MSQILFVTQIILSILILIVVLMQKSSSIGLGVYAGSNNSLFGAKGPASFISKLTLIFGVLFIINTMALGYFYNNDSQKSLVDDASIIPTQPTQLIPQAPVDSPFGNTNVQNPFAPKTDNANTNNANLNSANKEK